MNAPTDALGRLAQTRERLREAMLGVAPPVREARDPEHKGASAAWLADLKAQPAIGLMLDVVQAWWSRQPLRLVLMLASAASEEALRPAARAHPYRLVLTAAGAGALLALARPWRWVSMGALLTGVLPSMIHSVKHKPGPHRPR